jgi:uncharacterized membrane protein
MPPVTARSTPTRLFELDAARGFAMLLVCLAHFLDIYVMGDVASHSAFIDVLMLVCRAAAPTFVLISGILLGYQAEVRGAQFERFRLQLLDRALFLVTVGHLAISWSFAARFGFGRALAFGQITDTLAFCMLVGVYLVPAMNRRLRLLSGVCLAVGSCLLWPVWHPTDPLLQVIKNIFVGPVSGDPMVFLFPLLPWLGVYLAGTAAGGWLKDASRDAGMLVIRRFQAVSLVIIIGVLAIKAGFVARTYLGAPESAWSGYFSIYQKYPPGLLYLALYGGAGLLMISTLFSMSASPWIRSGMALAEPIGRNALPTFIVQFMVYYTGFYMVVTRGDGVTPSAAAVIWLISIMMLWGFAKTCEQYKISRFITVGLFSLIPARRQYSGAAAFDSQGCWSCTGEPLRTTGSALATGLSGSRSGHRRNRQREVNR